MIFETASGTRYSYDMRSNKIDAVHGDCRQSTDLPIDFDDVVPATSLPNIDTFIIELSQSCNLRCRYCCYGGSYKDNRRHSGKSFPVSEIESLIGFIKETRVPVRKLNIVFYGGEPLLRFKDVAEFVGRVRQAFNEDIDFTISTNGLLLEKHKILDWCINENIGLNVSLDGTEDIHDKNRIEAISGDPTYRRIYSILRKIKEKSEDYWYSRVNLLVTLESLQKLLPIAIYWGSDILLRTKPPYLISRISQAKIEDFQIDEQKNIEVLRALMDYFEVNRENVFVKAYFDMLSSPILERDIFEIRNGMTPLMCLPFNNRCFIDADGNLGICEKTSDKLRLGTISDGWDMDKVNQAMNKMVRERKKRCGTCPNFRLCKTCFTSFFYSDEWWEADCRWQVAWLRISLIITMELLERNLLRSEHAENLHLDVLRESDLESVFHLFSKESIVKYIDGLEKFTSINDSRRFFLVMSENLSNFAQSGKILAIRNEMASLIGIVGIDEITDESANLFFVIDDKYWHRGVMTAMLSDYLGRYLPDSVKKIETHINPENTAALSLAKRFSKIGVNTGPIDIGNLKQTNYITP